MIESGMRNLQGGDADSVGYFQMLTSAWNKGEYSGYPQQPELQVKWFIDTAVAVKHGVRNNPASWGTWIADVERIAHDSVGRHTADDYQAGLAEARHLLRRACDRE
jgi:hypothetical protein